MYFGTDSALAVVSKGCGIKGNLTLFCFEVSVRQLLLLVFTVLLRFVTSVVSEARVATPRTPRVVDFKS